MRNLVPSPLQSAWAFIGYLLIFVVPVWKIVSFLGDVGFVMGYAVPLGNFFATGWGIALLIAVGFGCLIYANYRERSALNTPPETSAPTEKQMPSTENEELRAARERLERVAYQTKQENDALRRKVQELEMTAPDEYRAQQDERRRRIQRWRAEIQNGDFSRTALGHSLFTASNTYLEMKPYLPRHVRDRFEGGLSGRTLHDLAYKVPRPSDKDLLLGEVARIEKEWGVH